MTAWWRQAAPPAQVSLREIRRLPVRVEPPYDSSFDDGQHHGDERGSDEDRDADEEQPTPVASPGGGGERVVKIDEAQVEQPMNCTS